MAKKPFDLAQGERAIKLTHLDAQGAMHMVDIGHKPATRRHAHAQAKVILGAAARRALKDPEHKKGDVLAAVRLAGIQAAKRTAELIPLCHALPLSRVTVAITPQRWGVAIDTHVETVAPTGVEMEALTAASIAALTLYDMLKAIERGIRIESVCLMEKTGAKAAPGDGGVAHPDTRVAFCDTPPPRAPTVSRPG